VNKSKGIVVYTKRSGHGYVFDDEKTDAQRIKVRLINKDFELTGKTVRCFENTLTIIGKINHKQNE